MSRLSLLVMSIEIQAGRLETNEIVYAHPSVSRHHLTIVYDGDGECSLEDHSRSGTYVDGHRVKKGRLGKQSHLLLGEYQVDVNKLFERLRKLYLAGKNDFTEDFKQLRSLFIAYEAKRKKIEKGDQSKSIYVRVGVMVVVVALLYFLPVVQGMRYALMAGAGALGTIMVTVLGKNKNKQEELQMLRSQFEDRLKCPKCQKSLANYYLKVLEHKKHCPHCKAVFLHT